MAVKAKSTQTPHSGLDPGEPVKKDKMEICELDITVSSRAGFIRIIFHN